MSTDDGTTDKKWSSYADYETIVESVADGVDEALDAYGYVNGVHTQDINMSEKSAINAKRALIWAGKRLRPEIRMNKDVERFEDIWERWEGEDGYMARLYDVNLREGMPGWLDQYTDDVLDAAWELGYIKAGREEPTDPDEDEVQVREAIK